MSALHCFYLIKLWCCCWKSEFPAGSIKLQANLFFGLLSPNSKICPSRPHHTQTHLQMHPSFWNQAKNWPSGDNTQVTQLFTWLSMSQWHSITFSSLLHHSNYKFIEYLSARQSCTCRVRLLPVSSCKLASLSVWMSAPRLCLSPFIFQFPPTKNLREAMTHAEWRNERHDSRSYMREKRRCVGARGASEEMIRHRCSWANADRSSSVWELQ